MYNTCLVSHLNRISQPAVRVRGIVKTFGVVHALRGVDLDLFSGEVHGLVGANGAGKSTLVKIISGALSQDAGSVEIASRELGWTTLAAHHQAGVATLYQETTIVPNMSAMVNAFLGRFRHRGPLMAKNQMRRDFQSFCEQLGLSIDPDTPAGLLPVTTQRMLEIIRALDARHEVLIMDEPTASLGPEECTRFYGVVRDLAAHGVSILYISHNLDEVLLLSDRVSVMREGELVETRLAKHWTKPELIRAMLGRDVAPTPEDSRFIREETALEVRSLSLGTTLSGISFDVRVGEILGIAGLVGSGRTELLRSLAGAEPAAQGELCIQGRKVPWPRSVRQALHLGIAMTPEDRRLSGIIPALPGYANITLSNLSKVSLYGVTSDRRQRSAAEKIADWIGLQRSMLPQPAAALSGGNQQKLVVGRWLHYAPAILLMDEPTRGIDVGAKQEMFHVIRRLAAQGMAVIFVSSELEEVVGIADRVIMLAQGRVISILPRGEVTVDRILHTIFNVGAVA